MLARSFYVLGDTKTPTVVGIASLFAGWIIKWLLLDPLGAEGIAIGISAYYLLSATTMLGILVYRQGPKILTGAITATTRAVVASSVACAACLVVYWITILRTWGAAPVGVAVYGLVMLLLREPDVCEAARVLKQRLLPNRSQD
jgi:peptidoglycan biosynthesis protein MviN/MurJ (putative lipid II flippase)